MRLLFFGTPDFAVPTLQALHGAGHDVAVVVTQPDRPRGRGGRMGQTAVKRAATALRLEVMQPQSANDPGCVDQLRERHAELGVVVAYGQILSPELLAVTEGGFINVHASLLPDYRGAAPINWAIIRGEEVTGVSVIRMSPQLDTGPVLAERSVPIMPDEDAGALHDRLARVGAAVCCDVVNRLDAGERMQGRPQPKQGGFFARKLTKQDGRLDWSLPAEVIRNRVRGLTPWPGAYCTFGGERREVRVTLLAVEAAADGGRGAPGTVTDVDRGGGIEVLAGQGSVVVRRLKPAGGREMDASDFVHGYRVRPGDRFV